MLVVVLLVLLSIFVWGEFRFLSALDQLTAVKDATPAQLEQPATLMVAPDAGQTAFRTFWFGTLQLLLLNVLFPTLTALLGYVFGTGRANSTSAE